MSTCFIKLQASCIEVVFGWWWWWCWGGASVVKILIIYPLRGGKVQVRGHQVSTVLPC